MFEYIPELGFIFIEDQAFVEINFFVYEGSGFIEFNEFEQVEYTYYVTDISCNNEIKCITVNGADCVATQVYRPKIRNFSYKADRNSFAYLPGITVCRQKFFVPLEQRDLTFENFNSKNNK